MTRRLTSRLKESVGTLAVAESCTGGRLAAAFTARAGASDYFLGGVVAYSNDVKENVLGVDVATLAAHGAVSRRVAEAMAVGVLRLMGADYSISTTGIAGPGGGSPEKPVGTVWIAVAGRCERAYMGTDSDTGERASADAGERAVSGANGSTFVLEACESRSHATSSIPTIECNVTARLFHFMGSREEIMNQSVEAAIEMLIGIL